jgi:hypothetical protein
MKIEITKFIDPHSLQKAPASPEAQNQLAGSCHLARPHEFLGLLHVSYLGNPQ